MKIKLTNSYKRKDVTWDSLKGTQRGEMAGYKVSTLATLESLGSGRADPGHHTSHT